MISRGADAQLRFPQILDPAGEADFRSPLPNVEKATLARYAPPQFLYVSGRLGRYYLRDLHCIYYTADMSIAGTEYERYRGGMTTQSVKYGIHANVLDLIERGVRDALG